MGARKGSLYFRIKFLSPIGGVANDEQQNSNINGSNWPYIRKRTGYANCSGNWTVPA